MALGDLKLTYASLSVTFGKSSGNKFLQEEMPRSEINMNQGESFTIAGNFLVSGTSYEPRHIYTVTASCLLEDCEKLRAMWRLSDAARRALGAWQMIVDDETERFFEATKTRSSVTATADISLNGGVYYYPRMQVFMPSAPIFGIQTGIDFRKVIISLQETGVKI